MDGAFITRSECGKAEGKLDVFGVREEQNIPRQIAGSFSGAPA